MEIFLKTEIIPYIDGNGLVAPNLFPPGTVRASDNGAMFTSEYYIMLNRNGEATGTDIASYQKVITACVGADGHLHRAPGDLTQDVIDNNLGVLAGYAEFGIKVPFSLPIDNCRFPQLVYAYGLNRGIPSLLMFPLSIISAFIIAFSGFSTAINNADARRLNWDLWQATKRKSLLNDLAGKFWHWHQSKLYGTNEVMRAVAAVYYQAGHPFIKYWKD